MADPAPPFRALVCDMDGTLYESAGEIDDYAGRVRDALPPERRAAFWSDWLLVRSGRHPIRVGAVYDDRLDWVLAVEDGRPVRAVALEPGAGTGREVPADELAREFPPEVRVEPPGEPDARASEAIRWVPTGDAWWLPPCLGRHHGASWEAVEAAYLAAREAMTRSGFRAEPLPGVQGVLARLREAGVHLVLATNTPADTGEPFLERLGLGPFFDEVVFDAAKPAGLEALVLRICRERGLAPHEVACVGDNWVNDVEPGVRLGCYAMLIDRYGVLAERMPAAGAGLLRGGTPGGGGPGGGTTTGGGPAGGGAREAGGDGGPRRLDAGWPRLIAHPSARDWVEWLGARLGAGGKGAGSR